MDSESELMISLISQMLTILSSGDDTPEQQSKFTTLTCQLISLVNSLDLDSQPEPESKIISLMKQTITVGNSVVSGSGPDSQLVTLVTKMISIINNSIDSDPKESEPELNSLISQIFSILLEMDPNSELLSLLSQLGHLVQQVPLTEEEKDDMASLINQIHDLVDAEEGRKPESRLISRITQLMSHTNSWSFTSGIDSKIISLIIRIIELISSMDLDSHKSELMSLITQTIAVYNSMDLDSQPQPLRKLISIFSQYGFNVKSTVSDSESDSSENYVSHVEDSLKLEPEPELISLIHQIGSLVVSMNPKWEKLISFCPQFELSADDHIPTKWNCLQVNWNLLKLPAEEKDFTHFRCRGCNGENHKENEKAPLEVKHPLHPKHPLQLVSSQSSRECYCCDEDLVHIFYCCLACNSAMNVACTKKPPVLYRDHPRWHEHTLALFPRQASLTCNLCALADSSSPIYMCPPCDFVVHLRCTGLPRVIKISRHLHRISFTFSFDQGDLCCSVCRRQIDEDYGGYSCIKDGCSYAAHSKCATQRNVWDGIELEGEPEEVEEEVVDPFVTISDGIIQHFGHPQHHLRLDENTSRDYDEDKLCQACVMPIMPIYFGNFYSCTQCNYILHEACANFSRKMHHPIHPHVLTLVNSNGAINVRKKCAACPWMCTTGFFYECSKEDFQLHVQCANLSEPLVHESHMHPLFLTSRPGEYRNCCACKESYFSVTSETFNCIECDFALCFRCATLPQKVRYKHDKHMLTLSYGEETSTMTYWCEVCERNLNPKERFYKCDKYCCITLHIECMLGEALYIKPGSSWISFNKKKMTALPSNHHMSRPLCFMCKKRCPHKIVFKYDGVIFCTQKCRGRYRY
ncbi:unnamed protein product [Arabidopsis halleri]